MPYGYRRSSLGSALSGGDVYLALAIDIALLSVVTVLVLRTAISFSNANASNKNMLKQFTWLAGFALLGCSIWIGTLS